MATAGALLDAKEETERAALLAATNPSGITLLMHACHTGKAEGVSMLLDKVCIIHDTDFVRHTRLHVDSYHDTTVENAIRA